MSGRGFFSGARLCVGGLIILLGACSIILPPARAQKAPPAQDTSPSEFTVLHLKHVDAAEVSKIVEELLSAGVRQRIRLIADPRTNALLLGATSDDTTVVKQCLNVLDQDRPAKPLKEQPFKVFQLRNIVPDEWFEKGLATVFPNGTGKYVIDRNRGAVIVAGDEECFHVTDSYLRLTDVPREKAPASQVRLRVVWLANGLAHKDALPPPRDMKKVVDELEALGIAELHVVSQSLINVTEGVPFTSDGVADLMGPCSLSIEGAFEARPGEVKALKLSVAAQQITESKPTPLCRLSSSIEASFHQLVVLGVTPTEKASSVFVIQVLPR